MQLVKSAWTVFLFFWKTLKCIHYGGRLPVPSLFAFTAFSGHLSMIDIACVVHLRLMRGKGGVSNQIIDSSLIGIGWYLGCIGNKPSQMVLT